MHTMLSLLTEDDCTCENVQRASRHLNTSVAGVACAHHSRLRMHEKASKPLSLSVCVCVCPPPTPFRQSWTHRIESKARNQVSLSLSLSV